MMDWSEIVKFIGTYAVLLVVTGLIARSIFNLFLSKDIDKFKLELRTEQEMELMKLRGRIEKVTSNGNSRSSRLQEKQADAIAKLYKLLSDAERAYETYSSANHPSGKLIKEQVKKTEKALWDFLEKNRLLIDPKLCAQVDRFYKKVFGMGINYTLPESKQQARNNGALKEFRLSFAKEIPKLKNQIETEFRVLLGSLNTFAE